MPSIMLLSHYIQHWKTNHVPVLVQVLALPSVTSGGTVCIIAPF